MINEKMYFLGIMLQEYHVNIDCLIMPGENLWIVIGKPNWVGGD